jgi:DnaA family protein
MKQLVLDIARPPAPTLDNFVPGRNEELVAALYATAHGASSEQFIYLWGAPGSGRSHLLRAAVAAARAAGKPATFFESGAREFDAPDDAFCAVDDVHLLDPQAQIALFNLHNRIKAGNGTLLASGNAAPPQLALRADLMTRLGAGLVFRVHGLNEEEKSRRCGATRRRAVSNYLRRWSRICCATCSATLPSLLALLDALDRYSLASRRAITLPLLRELLNA